MSLLPRIYKFYRYKVYKRWNEFRGATRLNDFLINLAQRSLDKPERKPESIFERGDWDNLFIIDACRHDLYEEVEGETPKRTTLGGHSREFIEKTFTEGDFSDVVYVTANPHFEAGSFRKFTGREIGDVFHEVYHTYETDWNDEEGVVLPGPLKRDARSAKKLFPDKKLVVHFMQPHHPFLSLNISEFDDPDVWNLAEKGKLDRKEVWKHYRKNLEFVMPHVRELAAELDGRTVLTSDHGNLVGERGLYHHPYGAPSKAVREVPWVEL